ncbi:MAG: hypothetical protein ABIJ86_05335 [Spirochaetota bacterium]
MNKQIVLRSLLACCLGLSVPSMALAQDQSSASQAGSMLVLDPMKAVSFIKENCLNCHDWASGYETMVSEGRVTPGQAEESPLYTMIRDKVMPPSPPALNDDELETLRVWIEAGVPWTNAVAGASDATSAVTEQVDNGFLFFRSRTEYHRISGWTSSGLLLAAGVVGAVRAYDLMSSGHEYRDANSISEGEISSLCADEINSLWAEDQSLRWAHIGLLISGETLYLGNAITGIAMISSDQPGVISRSQLHRYSFFIHAALMATEMVLGFSTTDALSRGDHGAVVRLGVAHASIGLAIPLVMIGSGLIMDL